MDADLTTALVADKLSSLALLGIGIAFLWRRYTTASDRLIGVMTQQIAEVVVKLGELKSAVEVGLAGLAGKITALEAKASDHGRRLDHAERTLDRHAVILETLHEASRSGIYNAPGRPRLAVADEEPPR